MDAFLVRVQDGPIPALVSTIVMSLQSVRITYNNTGMYTKDISQQTLKYKKWQFGQNTCV